MEDPYKILGVARDAAQGDIQKAYRKLAKKHHPDLNPGHAPAEEKFKEISAANALLSDPIKRGQFDRGEIDGSGQARAPRSAYRDHAQGDHGRRYGRDRGQNDGQNQGWSEQEFDDLFGAMFSADRRNGERPGPENRRPGRDELYALTTDFLAAVNGATRRLTLPDGRSLDVKIPPGSAEGQVMRLRGRGGEGWNGGPAGDALIEIHVAPHRFFERDGQDIRLVLPVTVSEAVLGGQVETPTPAGPVKMRVPPRSDSGTALRLRGRGVPAHGDRDAGDLWVTLRVMVGPPDAALEAFLRDRKPDRAFDPRASMEAGQ